MSTNVTIAGRLTRDPELRFSSAGKPIASFSVVASQRRKNQVTGEWEDHNTSFYDCTAFGPMAENICNCLQKGTGVIVVGNMHQEEYTTKEGEKKRSWRVLADDVAASCKFRTVTVSEGSAAASRPVMDEEPPF